MNQTQLSQSYQKSQNSGTNFESTLKTNTNKNNINLSMMVNGSVGSSSAVYTQSKDLKNVGNMMKVLKNVVVGEQSMLKKNMDKMG